MNLKKESGVIMILPMMVLVIFLILGFTLFLIYSMEVLFVKTEMKEAVEEILKNKVKKESLDSSWNFENFDAEKLKNLFNDNTNWESNLKLDETINFSDKISSEELKLLITKSILARFRRIKYKGEKLGIFGILGSEDEEGKLRFTNQGYVRVEYRGKLRKYNKNGFGEEVPEVEIQTKIYPYKLEIKDKETNKEMIEIQSLLIKTRVFIPFYNFFLLNGTPGDILEKIKGGVKIRKPRILIEAVNTIEL